MIDDSITMIDKSGIVRLFPYIYEVPTRACLGCVRQRKKI